MNEFQEIVNCTNSKIIKSVFYSEKRSSLVVELRNKDMYVYKHVPLYVVVNFLTAPTLGGYYNKHIKNTFECLPV